MNETIRLKKENEDLNRKNVEYSLRLKDSIEMTQNEDLRKKNQEIMKENENLAFLLFEKTAEIENLKNKMNQIKNQKFAEETRREPTISFTNESFFELMEKKIGNLRKIIEIIRELIGGFKGLVMESERESKFIGDINSVYEGFMEILQGKNEEFQQKNKALKERKNLQSKTVNSEVEFIKIFHFGDDLIEKICEKKGK